MRVGVQFSSFFKAGNYENRQLPPGVTAIAVEKVG